MNEPHKAVPTQYPNKALLILLILAPLVQQFAEYVGGVELSRVWRILSYRSFQNFKPVPRTLVNLATLALRLGGAEF